MSAEWICDGCGRREPGEIGLSGNWFKPSRWYEKTVFEDEGSSPFGKVGRAKTTLSACSRACIESASKKAGVHSLVLPV